MEIVKIVGIGLIGTIIVVILKKTSSEFSMMAGMITGFIILAFIIAKLTGIVDLLYSLIEKTGINYKYLEIILKITGIAYIVEFASNISKDAGQTSIASKIELAGKVLIVSLSIPILTAMLDVVSKII